MATNMPTKSKPNSFSHRSSNLLNEIPAGFGNVLIFRDRGYNKAEEVGTNAWVD